MLKNFKYFTAPNNLILISRLRVYILDLMTLLTVLSEEDLEKFVESFFVQRKGLVIGFSLK
jgi:hypothetical protein